MSQLELRPLSLGEILDRTFTLYRAHLVLFVALAAIPRLPSVAFALLQAGMVGGTPVGIATTLGLGIIAVLIGIAGYLISQGGAVVAVSEIYLGRQITIVEALKRTLDELWPLLAALFLSGLAIFAGFIFLVVPGIYMICRLLVVVPAVMIERKGPGDSFSRSMQLTKGFAGRAFLILLLYCVLALGFTVLAALPFAPIIAAAANNPAMMRIFLAGEVIFSAAIEFLLTPILLIATSIYYYDLRVRKEAFDLQVMMDPDGANIPRSSLRSFVPGNQ